METTDDKKITTEHRRRIRHAIGDTMAMLHSEMAQHGYSPAETTVELLASLLSLSSFICSRLVGMSRSSFMNAARLAAEENDGHWGVGAPAPPNEAVPGGGKSTPVSE